MKRNDTPKSSLRNNIMVAFSLAIILLGMSITATSQHILRRVLGEVQLPPEVVEHIGQQFIQVLTGFTIAGILLALAIAALVSKTITRSIKELLQGVTTISNGHLGARIEVTHEDEFGQLADAFNAMAERLKQSHEDLEDKVEHRTAELSRTNESLQREIAERIRAEETAHESEQRLKTILNSVAAGLFIIDPETHVVLDANANALKLVGLPREQIVGRVCHQFLCPAEQGNCPITDQGQEIDRSERILLRADGTPVPILKSVTTGTLRDKEYLIESFIDITERKQADETLKESHSLLKATLESTVDGILAVDGKGRIKNFNSRFMELWRLPDSALANYDDDEALAVAITRLKEPEAFRAKVKDLYSRPADKGNGVVEFKDGRIVEYFSKPQFIGDEITGRVWSFRDVTERHGAQQKQMDLLRRVAEINEELTHFAYVVSHDLKAPLRGIRLITEWLCADYADQLGEEGQEQIDLLQNRVDRMHNLIEGILQYSRVGRIKEELISVDVDELLSDIIDAIAPPENIDITVAGPLPVIECERTRITQVFQNLLSNAVKYMDKPHGKIEVACADAGDLWQFSIRDNGPGIEDKHFDRIFRIFQTLTPRDEFESTGVGLTLVKKIVEMYGGRIWVESELSKGSTFFFTIPKQLQEIHDAPDVSTPAPESAPADSARETVAASSQPTT